MPFVITAPDLVAAATDLASIGSTISAANATVAAVTTGMLAPAADAVSAAVAASFGAHSEPYQAFSSHPDERAVADDPGPADGDGGSAVVLDAVGLRPVSLPSARW